jgi:hypothetical protein
MTKPTIQDRVLAAVQAKRPEVTMDKFLDATEWLVSHGYLRRTIDIYGQTKYDKMSKPDSALARDLEQDPISL